MSRRTFTENVINLAIENCLVSDLADILTAGMVFKMSEDKLRQIASESEEVIAERSRMQDEVAILEQALYKCRLNKPRATTGSLIHYLSAGPDLTFCPSASDLPPEHFSSY